MTRLTPEMICQVPYKSSERDDDLNRCIGTDLKGLACDAVGLLPNHFVAQDYLAAAVPVTCGKSTIKGFSESVCAIVEHLGMRAFTTRKTDVAGLAEALQAKVDIVFMADDEEFIALNVNAGRSVNNTRSTALGYLTALRRAAGPLAGKEILLIGAGRIGNVAADMLVAERAKVTVVDIDAARVEGLINDHPGFRTGRDLEAAVRQSSIIFNASPARIPGEWIREGAVISSPGMPFSYDDVGIRKMKALIHDPLQIGVSVMALWSASLSLPTNVPVHHPLALEVIS